VNQSKLHNITADIDPFLAPMPLRPFNGEE